MIFYDCHAIALRDSLRRVNAAHHLTSTHDDDFATRFPLAFFFGTSEMARSVYKMLVAVSVDAKFPYLQYSCELSTQGLPLFDINLL